MIAHTRAADARQAVRELHATLGGQPLALLLFFCSSEYGLEDLADEMNRLFADMPVIGCTTAGEIGPLGYATHSLVGIAFPAGDFVAVAGYLDRLASFDAETGRGFAIDLLDRLEAGMQGVPARHRCALQFIDGLSQREEAVAHTLQRALGQIPLVGGSASDDLKLVQPQVFCQGAFRPDSVALTLIDTTHPLTVFKTQHFVGEPDRLVVTEADPATRTVKELNGLPAASEYARVLGIPVEQLAASVFSASPVVVRINGVDYVRSIQRANPDGSLTFYCAIDSGLILHVAHGVDFLGNLQHLFDDIRQKIGEPQCILACDCILRRLEIADHGWMHQAGQLMQAHHAVGFSTYGEQFMGMHVNQTLTGLAFGTAGATDE